MLGDDRIAVCAAGEAAWHAAAFAGLGADWLTADGLAWAPRVPHRYLLGAITLRPTPVLPDEVAGIVRDSWAALELDDRWTVRQSDPWMYRAPAPCQVPMPLGISIEQTADAELFERVAFLSAGGAPPDRPGELHPSGSESFDGLSFHLAWRVADGRREPIGAALAVVHDTGVVVSGVGVASAHRRAGVGAALTAAALGTAPDRPATLNASDLGMGTYTRLGFVPLGRPRDWVPRNL